MPTKVTAQSWEELFVEARNQGLTIDEVREILAIIASNKKTEEETK